MIIDIKGTPEIYFDTLLAICGDISNKTLLDLGAGEAPHTKKINFISKTYVDVFYRDFKEESKNFINVDIFYFLSIGSHLHYDVCIASDVAEHFIKSKALELLNGMESISAKQIIFTPIGEYVVETTPTNNPDSHKCGFLPQEFEDIGWATIAFPNFHPTLNIGAFFAFKCDNLKEESHRIFYELNKKSWAK